MPKSRRALKTRSGRKKEKIQAPRAVGIKRSSELRMFLEREIYEGRLLPGDALNEQAVAERFQISRTPVREAFLQLGSLGLISFLPRRGAVVARLSTRQIVGMREVFTELEALCAQLSARRMSVEERDHLSKIYEESRDGIAEADVAAYSYHNLRFHEALYAGAKNCYLAKQISDLRTRLRPYTGKHFFKAGGIERSLEGHRRIVEAVLAGDDSLAAKAMREHILLGAQSFQDLIAELTSADTEDA